MTSTHLDIGGKKILTTEVKYNDLVWLYNDFIKKYNHVPTIAECLSKNNLPQGRIIKRVLEESKITYNDFMLQFGKVSHVRTESKDYDLFVDKFKQVCNDCGRTLNLNELTNNEYGLPGANWFIEYCPNELVHSYDGFVKWCGCKSNKLERDKQDVSNALINLEAKLGRPIRKYDITLENVGFSNIVVNRIWGGLKNAKEELGLLSTPPNVSKPFKYYKYQLDEILNKIRETEDRECVSWHDIENDKYLGYHIEHKTYTKAFKKEGIDFASYLKSRGFTMNVGGIGYSYTFDDGEQVKSIYEYDFSRFLRNELGLVYNQTYFRNVKYNTFSNIDKRIDCDYVIKFGDELFYIEIAGIIYNNKEDNWRITEYSSKRENDYRDKMILKENLLADYSKPFLFLFPRDMLNDSYKEKTKQLMM